MRVVWRFGLSLGIGLGLALAAGKTFADAAPPRASASLPAEAGSARKAGEPAPADPEGLLVGLDTLEDPADRALPLVGPPRLVVPGPRTAPLLARPGDPGSREREARARVASEREVRQRLGAGWTLEPLGARPGAWVLRGPAVRLPEGTGFDAVRAIAASLPALFGAEAGARLEPVFDRASEASGVVRMGQVVDGARVVGADVLAVFDARGRLVRLVSSYRTDLDPPSSPPPSPPPLSIAASDAEAIAREDLRATHPGITILGAPSTRLWLWPGPDGALARTWIVRQATRDPWGSFVTRIDAATGAVRARENAAQRKPRTGEGLVFRTNADYPDRPRTEKIPGLMSVDQDPEGHLEGMRFRVLDEKGNRVASAKLRYRYYPFEEWDAFDQVSAYYHLERAHARFQKSLGVRGLPWFDGPDVPAIANVRQLCDAYYSADLQGEAVPGFAFGDQATCETTVNEDYARDSDVVYHEYTHAVVDWSGIGLQDAPVDSYQRALAEADADYHAAEFTGDPTVGEVMGLPRTVANASLYPFDVGCWYGFPEEHCTSAIWSGLLWDVRGVVPKAERLEFASLDYLVDHPGISHTPDWLDFWDAAVALLDADEHLNEGRNAGILYGLAASRGIFGPLVFPGDYLGFVSQTMDRGTRFKSIGRVSADEGSGVPYYFTAPAGSRVSIKVRTTSGLHPDFLVGEALGYPLEYFTAASDKNAQQATLDVSLPATDGLYVVTVRGAGGSTGSFQISIVVER